MGLDDYYSVEVIDGLVKEYEIDVDRVYMWPKGETGRLSIHIEHGDIETLDRLLSENACIAYADIKYNEEAEAYAGKKGKDTYCIELPAKPDNAA